MTEANLSILKTVYQVNGSMVIPVKDINMPKPLEKLPPLNYQIRFSPKIGYYLEQSEEFTLPPKLYGNVKDRASRILNTFLRRKANTGVMLCGEKGGGKTMTSRAICKLAAAVGMPTLIVSEPHCGDAFNDFLAQIQQQAVVLMDEFEKVYNSEQQQAMLTVLDGVFQSNKLFLLTCNRSGRLDVNLSNRPGRIHYWLEYKGLSPEEIKEYSEDRLEDKTKVNDVVNASAVFQGQMNFDMLRALVEETNLYPKDPITDHLKILNLHPNWVSEKAYRVEVSYKGQVLDPKKVTPAAVRINPTAMRKAGPGEQESTFTIRFDSKLIGLVRYGYFNDLKEENEEAREQAEIRAKKENPGATGDELEKIILSSMAKPKPVDETLVEHDDVDYDGEIRLSFTADDMKQMKHMDNKYIFEHSVHPVTVVLVREEERDYRATYYGDAF